MIKIMLIIDCLTDTLQRLIKEYYLKIEDTCYVYNALLN